MPRARDQTVQVTALFFSGLGCGVAIRSVVQAGRDLL